ncbi:MAG: amino acid adenylation domain-containing protein [Niabella sp.]
MTKRETGVMITDIRNAFERYADNNAFVIEDETYTYSQLARSVYGIANLIRERQDKIIGVVAENKLETYASILAVLLCGKTYVVLHPDYPAERNDNIARQAGINLILHSQAMCFPVISTPMEAICTTGLQSDEPTGMADAEDDGAVAYIIFTSGSTGEPKGVPISRRNLNAFYHAYQRLGWHLNEKDRMLQMFELTFDVSVVSFLYPLTFGACVYTVSSEGIKYLNTIDVMERHELTFAAVAPSLLQLVSPYFSEIRLPKLNYLVVTAEASSAGLLADFRVCAPNATFVNLYGPTESTIYCTAYTIPQTGCKHHNGMIAIGKPFDGISICLMDECGKPVAAGARGELWVSGEQVMKGYWNAPEKSEACLTRGEDGKIYYKTGDLCQIDEEGDAIYCGRKDYQVKVQGFRIELSEIEYVAKNYFEGKYNVVVIPEYPEGKGCELHLVVESTQFDKEALQNYISHKLPPYMVPKYIDGIAHFPLNNSNKIDRKKIHELM